MLSEKMALLLQTSISGNNKNFTPGKSPCYLQ